MKLKEIKSPVSSLNGIGPALSALFAKLNIFTVGDLLSYYPKSYEDRRKTVPLKDFEKSKVHTIASVTSHEWFGYGRMKTLKLNIRDQSAAASLICFNRPFMDKTYPVGSVICVSGDFSVKYSSLQSSSFDIIKISDSGNPEDFKDAPLPDAGIIPVYGLTEGLSQKSIRKAVECAINHYDKGIDTELPEYIIQKRNILSKADSIRFIHLSENPEELKEARRSLIYEELFNLEKTIAERAFRHKGSVPDSIIPDESKNFEKDAAPLSLEENKAFLASLSPLQTQLLNRLPFELTSDQKQVIFQMNGEIDKGYLERNDLSKTLGFKKTPFTMQRLLQGDVGSGKTLVCFFAVLRAINWKGQCALMAPTEILARQHAENAAKLLEPLGVRVAFLTGNVKASGRAALLKALKSGDIDFVIGTHALFSANVVYNDLQLAIIDEQHRFGVVQREAIVNKGRHSETLQNLSFEPHLLMMSATPIPQTLALTAFGDLDVSVIKSMPVGRIPVQTYLVKEGNERNAYEAVRNELKKGHQAYFVYPAISTDNSSGDIKNAEDAFRNLSSKVYPEYSCALLHSKVPEEKQIQILEDFKNGKIQILACTTVIEVGVDVPSATCIVIEQADRFGLAQLHQLRGRVGRGKDQSFCFLIYSEKITQTGIERMKVLRTSNDGFEIASKDLKIRGPGEITGTLQSGALTLGIADLSRDQEQLLLARQDAFDYVKQRIQKDGFFWKAAEDEE